MTIYEDSRIVSRADLAAWLRQLADQLDTGQLFYGAGGKVTVADRVECEFEVEREGDHELSVEIEFTWTTEDSVADDEDEDDEDEDDEDDDEPQ